MIRIKILKNMSESLEKKNPVSGPSGREHPHVKYNLLLLIVLVTSKLTRTKLLSGQIRIKIFKNMSESSEGSGLRAFFLFLITKWNTLV